MGDKVIDISQALIAKCHNGTDDILMMIDAHSRVASRLCSYAPTTADHICTHTCMEDKCVSVVCLKGLAFSNGLLCKPLVLAAPQGRFSTVHYEPVSNCGDSTTNGG